MAIALQNKAEGGKAIRAVILASLLFIFWLLMSGLTKTLLISLAVISVTLSVWFSMRMDKVDGNQLAFHLNPFRLVGYTAWLFVEIIKANWAVTRIIISPDMPIRQKLFNVPATQATDIAQVIFANSITLTPGTITVETEQSHFLVHAVAYNDSDPDSLAEMDRRVTSVETSGA